MKRVKNKAVLIYNDVEIVWLILDVVVVVIVW